MTLADRIIARLKAELGDFTSPAKLEAAARGVLEEIRGQDPVLAELRRLGLYSDPPALSPEEVKG